MINEYITPKGRTEDGDHIFRKTYECDTIQDAREATKIIKERYRREYIVWEGKGGKLVCFWEYSVDQVEIAIERRNDEWASWQTEIEEGSWHRRS